MLTSTICQYVSLTIQLGKLDALRTSSSEVGVILLSWAPSESEDNEPSVHTLEVEGSAIAVKMDSFANLQKTEHMYNHVFSTLASSSTINNNSHNITIVYRKKIQPKKKNTTAAMA